MTRRRLASTLVVAGLLAAVPACTSSSRRPVTVTVRDAETLAPMADVVVQVRPAHLFVPTYPGRIVGSTTAGETATTDASGVVGLRVPSRQPFDLVVLVPWEPPRGLTIESLTHQAADDAPWIELLQAPESDVGVVEVQIRRGS